MFMFSSKKFLSKLLILLCAVLCLFSAVPLFSANAASLEIYLGGFPAGFVLNTTSVEVVGVCGVLTEDGLKSPARDCGIKTGDVIEKINGKEVTCSEDVSKLISDKLKVAEITVARGSEELSFTVTPVKELTSGNTRIGVLVKDSLNGVGTVTYIDKTAGKFGSLGHPVTDSSNNVIEINGGKVYGCVIYDVKKGVRGTPGELKGAFDNNCTIGNAAVNTSSGVFGNLAEDYDVSGLKKVTLGTIDSVTPGKAVIYSTINSNLTECYDITIVKVDKGSKDNRNFVIKIEDEDLIEKTGGIVQGMSGSPIVQNGKLVGAVTHVFINDPTRGYGISIENMMNSY